MINRSGFVTNYASTVSTTSSSGTGKSELDMNDFYKLMAAQLQNQDMTSPMDQSEFMGQMTQMAVIQAINTFKDVTINSYAASLVGKEVTVAEIDSKGSIKEVFGKITATGLYSGEQVIFVDDQVYKMSQIMAIGKLPANEETPPVEDEKGTEEVDPSENESDNEEN